jgi:hypothetical protein
VLHAYGDRDVPSVENIPIFVLAGGQTSSNLSSAGGAAREPFKREARVALSLWGAVPSFAIENILHGSEKLLANDWLVFTFPSNFVLLEMPGTTCVRNPSKQIREPKISPQKGHSPKTSSIAFCLPCISAAAV